MLDMQPARVAVVDDDRFVREMLELGLTREGYTVRTASDGLAALDLVRAWDPEVIVLDIMMPKMDGITLLPRLRELTQAPILMLTAKGETADKVSSLGAGADDYLVKPFAFAELLARVRVLLRRGQPTPEKLQLGDLVLDSVRRRVTRNGEPIDLAPKEFSILEYMLRNQGRPLSRMMIVEHVWDMDYDGLTNIVDVYIRHLRSKIDDRWPTKLIHTVRGIGYKLELPEDYAANNPATGGSARI